MALSVATIPGGVSFVDALAQGLMEESEDGPFDLPDVLVLLPNRRSCRALRDAFLRVSGGKPMLLPVMRPIGETDEDELLVSEGVLGDDLDLPPVIPPVRRILLLTRLIREHAPDGTSISLDQAARLAGDLARLLDQVQTEGLYFDALEDLVPDRYAAHWQKTLSLLQVITRHWPETLAAEGCLDPGERRNRLLRAQAAAWRKAPPDRRIVAAGSTGSIPAVAELLGCVSQLPRGSLILPGFDRHMDATAAQAAAADQTHPQFGMLRLLSGLGLAPAQVVDWPSDATTGAEVAGLDRRRALVSEVMRPAATTDAWRSLPQADADVISGLSRVDCPGEAEEAKVIALALRLALETSDRTAALVTPDRGLARRVAAALRRWDLEIDDSAGMPLSQTPPGLFLQLVAEMVRENFAPVATLAALKHPFAAGGRSRDRFRGDVRLWERWALRGPRPEAGVPGLLRSLPNDLESSTAEALRALLKDLADRTAPLAKLMAGGGVSFMDLVRAHVATAEALADNDTIGGADVLWSGEAGEAMAEFIDEVIEAAARLGSVAPAVYPALLSTLMTGRVVRPRFGRHPRLHIWGPIEARLQNADLIILGGLNEGNWPRNPDPDPWLSRPMQESFGLPLPERRIGLSAHDFALAVCAPEVMLTRAEKAGGSPTVPSRWLARLNAVLMASLPDRTIDASTQWLAWERALDRVAEIRPVDPPAPRPPLAARPRRLSVTRIEAWMRDPYSIYARHILRLRALDPLEADPAAADRGTVIHETLDRFVRAYPGDLPAGAEERLLEIGREVFQSIASHPVVHAFWWPRFERVARWFIETERLRRGTIAAIATEVDGELAIAAPGGAFTLTAVADRIDRLEGGGYTILDYKTGAAPSNTELRNGFAPQLPLEAAIAASGGFAGLGPAAIAGLAFWRLSGGAPPGEIKDVKGDPNEIAEAARAGLMELVSAFDDEDTPYAAIPDAVRAPRFNDYTLLARVGEWAGLPDDEAP